MNHFKTALNDPEILQKYENKPYHMAVLTALSKFAEAGHKLSDLPWFRFCKK